MTTGAIAERVDRRVGFRSEHGEATRHAMAGGGGVRNRSEIVTVMTPRGPVEILRQEMRGLRQGSSWTWFWVARRKGRGNWFEASTVHEAIRKATLLPPRRPPSWLRAAASDAERQITDAAGVQPSNDPPPAA